MDGGMMDEQIKYLDLSVANDDLSLDVGGNVETCKDRDVIAQDLVHMIREKGYLPPLVGNRNRDIIDQTIVKITLAVDNDYRIVPGSATIEETGTGTFYLMADTIDFDSVYIELG
jgi:hypothetical protein